MWWEVLSVSITLQLFADLGNGVTVTQKDRFLITTVGNSTKIHCGHDDATYHTILWYRQESNSAEKKLQLIGYSIEGNPAKMEDNEDKGYNIERPSVTEAFLSTPVQKAVDPAVYFCAASKGSAERLYFGQGTRLTVIESKNDISPPRVTIFDPSTQELQAKQKVTIVCVVTDFYPDHVNLTWSMDGNGRTEGVKTEEPKSDEVSGKKFSLVSRLRITRQEWEKTKEFQCNVYFDPEGKVISDILTKSCDNSDAAKESYLRSINFGKLIYILLIFKSILYGAFVTICMLRKKSMKENPFS